MQMYKLISGNTQNIGEFEQNISTLLEDGYAIEGPLVALGAGNHTQLFQAMIAEDVFLEEDEEEDEDEDE